MSNSMFRRFLKEESGMAMGLVVIMIVLIGVMGAGLLTFVQRDLENVVEVNRGQKAIEVSDAGLQAARRQLLVNSFPNQYNDPSATPLSPEAANSPWAFDSGSATCGSLAAGPGRCITTPEGNVRVTIKYLPPPTTETERKDPNFAPEALPAGASDYKDQRDYFRVETDGVFSGARRKIQAILVTEDLNLPKAYFSTNDIDLGPSCSALTVTNVSLFARGNITGLRDCTLQGTDLAYGNWQNDNNDKGRRSSSGTPVVGDAKATGAGAEGNIEYQSSSYDSTQKGAPDNSSDRYKRVDFDGTANLTGSGAQPSPNYKFCDRDTACWPSGTPQPTNVITYPFNDDGKLDPAFLQSIAEQQVSPTTEKSNYVQTSGTSVPDIDQTTFHQVDPALSSVMVIRFTGSKGSVDIQPTGSSTPCPIKGTILVINGDIKTSSGGGGRCFDGIISIQDPTPATPDLTYDSTGGGFSLNGFLNVEGTIKLGGNVSPILGLDVLNQPGYHDVKIWSWRECYKEACN